MPAKKTIIFEISPSQGQLEPSTMVFWDTNTDKIARLAEVLAAPAAKLPNVLILELKWSPDDEPKIQAVNLLIPADNTLQFGGIGVGNEWQTVRFTRDALQQIRSSNVTRKFHGVGDSDNFVSRVKKDIGPVNCQFHKGLLIRTELCKTNS